MTITTDEIGYIYLNGVQLANAPNYNRYATIDLISLINRMNVIAVKGTNLSGYGGIIASDSAGTIWTNSSWRCSGTYVAGWASVGFDDTAWPHARVIDKNGGPMWGNIASISADACWIWTSAGTVTNPTDITVYCRLTLGI